jgi:type IV secretion system protein VirB2
MESATKKGMAFKAMMLGKALLRAGALAAVMTMPAFAGPGDGYGGTQDSVCGFLGDINGLLSIASIAVVTIAIIFAGYQIAFAHKRIADVAPILIGGLLIGAAGQIASMIMPENEQCTATPTGSSITIESPVIRA